MSPKNKPQTKEDREDAHDLTRLYELTHNMTEIYADLYSHPRDCDCPMCEGQPEDWEDF